VKRQLSIPTLAVELAVLFVALWFMLHLNPSGFGGGPFDDQRYMDAARAWLAHPPLVGTTHWEMRHTLIGPLALIFGLAGASMAHAMWVPLAAAFLVAGIGFGCIRAAAGGVAAWTWAALFLTTPLFLRIGTSVFPEIVELLFVSVSLWAFWFGRSARRPVRLYLLSGLAAAFAVMTRETAAWIALIYVIAFLIAPGSRRIDYLWIVVAGAAPLLIEWIWLFAATGDPLYRLHVATHHVAIPSANMVGGVAHVDHVLFNPAVGRLWKPPGLFHVHWAANPLLGLFADPKYGAAIWAAMLFAVVPGRQGTRMRGAGTPSLGWGALLAALLSFGFATYALMISQDQRYYAAALYAIALLAGLGGDRLWRSGRSGLVTVLVILVAVSNLLLASQLGRFDYAAPVAMPLVLPTRERILATEMTAGQLAEPLREAGHAGQVEGGLGRPGELYLIVEGGGASCADPMDLDNGTQLVGCRASDPPGLIRWQRHFAPHLKMPAALTKGGARAILIRLPPQEMPSAASTRPIQRTTAG
jgi:hypothetical protein